MKNMIEVGTSKEAVREARAAIMDVLKSSNTELVKIAALSTLATLCNPSMTMSGCTLTSAAK